VNPTRPSALPAHYELTWSQLVFSALASVVAYALIAVAGWRIVSAIDVRQWWVPLVVVAGVTAAVPARWGGQFLHPFRRLLRVFDARRP
jgi:hypothetical protein